MINDLKKEFPDLKINEPFYNSYSITKDPKWAFVIIFQLDNKFGLIKRVYQGYSGMVEVETKEELVVLVQEYFAKSKFG